MYLIAVIADNYDRYVYYLRTEAIKSNRIKYVYIDLGNICAALGYNFDKLVILDGRAKQVINVYNRVRMRIGRHPEKNIEDYL